MNCSGAMTACTRGEAHAYQGVNGPVFLCLTCWGVAQAMGMKAEPLPAWLARAYEGTNRAKDYTEVTR